MKATPEINSARINELERREFRRSKMEVSKLNILKAPHRANKITMDKLHLKKGQHDLKKWFMNSEIMTWVAIKDRLPENDPNGPNVFITCDLDGFVYGSGMFFGGGCMPIDGFYSLVYGEWVFDGQVTHWMPLPKPPERETST